MSAMTTTDGQSAGFRHTCTIKWLGLPHYDVRFEPDDTDPALPAIAKGVLAIGGRARGIFALGLEAQGVFLFGVLSRGVFSGGILSIGVLSVGVVSLGVVGPVPSPGGFLNRALGAIPNRHQSKVEHKPER